MRPVAALALGALLGAGAHACAAMAQTPQASPTLTADRAQLASCLRQAQSTPQGCVGLVAISCVRETAGDRVRAEQGCARREEAVWRERLTLTSQALGRRLDAGQRARFVALQLAWEGFVAQKCLFYAGQQPSAAQPGRQAGCELREVARRALELEPMMRQAPPTRRPQGRPEIFR